MYVREGFPGQRLRVLSRPLVDAALQRPILQKLLVTDAGYFPQASDHGRFRPHGAPEVIVILCVSGVGWVEVNDQPYRVGKGVAVVLPAAIRHRYHADVYDPWSIWWAHVTGADVNVLVEAILGSPGDPLVQVRDVFACALAFEEAMQALEADETDASLFRAAGAMWRLLAILASDRQRGPTGQGDRVEQIQDYLRANLQTRETVADLAQRVHLSPSHFSALFKKATGLSVMEYLQRLRLARARELLTTTDASIRQVSTQVGYVDPLYFSRVFRRANGVSASEFRSTNGRATHH